MIALEQALRMALAAFVWQGVLVALGLWLAFYLLRRQSAQARYAAACAALALMMALPVVTGWRAYRAPSATANASAAAEQHAKPTAIVLPQLPNTIWMARIRQWMLPLWAVGVLFFSLRLGWVSWRVSAMRRRASPADPEILAAVAALAARMGLARPVKVLAAVLPDGPSVAGWLRPVLLLPPATALGLTPEELEAILAHELAHIRRYDHLVNAAQTLIETLLFYHPAVWWVSAQIREERELCCDDLAVRACGNALCFARALTRLERLRITAPAAAMGSTGGTLRYRVERLLGRGECAPSKLSGILAWALAVACLTLNVYVARAQDQGVPGVLGFVPDADDAGVSVDLAGAPLLHRSTVRFPAAALQTGIEGTVVAELTLDAGGNVADAHVVSGPLELRKAVMSAVFDWHFVVDTAGATRRVSVTFSKVATQRTDGPRLALRIVPDNSANRIPVFDSQPRGVEGGVIGGVAGGVVGGVIAGVPAGSPPPPPLEGQVIHSIEVNGLSDTARDSLLALLPAHEGDAVTDVMLKSVDQAVKKFDEHLAWRVEYLQEGGVTIQIETRR